MVTPPVDANRFQLMARIVQEQTPPVYWFGDGLGANYCHRLMRNLRIGVYLQDLTLLRKAHEQLLGACGELYGRPDPLVRICNNPFDTDWFTTLPKDLQQHILPSILFHTPFFLETDAEALAYTLTLPFRRANPVAKNPGLYLHVVTRLMLGGRLEEAEKLLGEVNATVSFYGLKGSLRFLRGEYEAAAVSYETDLKELRRHLRQRNAFFGGFEGVFFVLTQLQSETLPALSKADGLIEAALAKHRGGSVLLPVFQALKAVQLCQTGQTESAGAWLTAEGSRWSGVASFFQVLAGYWANGQLDQQEIDVLSELFIRSREVGLNWLALECAELLCRAEQNTPVRRNAIDKIRQETGLDSFVATIRLEEPWRRSLRALSAISGEGREGAVPAAGSRLIWLLDYSHGMLSVQPVEQKRTARGAWSKGRMVALSRLFGGAKPTAFTLQDQTICATIEREGRHYYNTRYFFNTNRMLVALVGHTRGRWSRR